MALTSHVRVRAAPDCRFGALVRVRPAPDAAGALVATTAPSQTDRTARSPADVGSWSRRSGSAAAFICSISSTISPPRAVEVAGGLVRQQDRGVITTAARSPRAAFRRPKAGRDGARRGRQSDRCEASSARRRRSIDRCRQRPSAADILGRGQARTRWKVWKTKPILCRRTRIGRFRSGGGLLIIQTVRADVAGRDSEDVEQRRLAEPTPMIDTYSPRASESVTAAAHARPVADLKRARNLASSIMARARL